MRLALASSARIMGPEQGGTVGAKKGNALPVGHIEERRFPRAFASGQYHQSGSHDGWSVSGVNAPAECNFFEANLATFALFAYCKYK